MIVARRSSAWSRSRRAVVTLATAALIIVSTLAGAPASASPASASSGPPPLELTGRPVVSGTPTVGQRLTSTAGTWNPRNVSISFQWLADGQAIAGASQSAYYPTGSDLGKHLSTVVTAQKSGYSAVGADSAASPAIQPGKARISPAPSISGEARVGATLQGYGGTSSRGDLTLTVQWLRGGSTIPGATGQTYTLTQADLGAHLRFRITVSGSGYLPTTATSSASAGVTSG